MRKLLRLVTFLFITSVLSGCASMDEALLDESPANSVAVETPNCPGASCVLKNDGGTYYIKETPGSVAVGQASGILTVVCEKNGFKDVVTVTGGDFLDEMLLWSNILRGDVIGLGVDAVVFGTWHVYPAEVINPLKCDL